MVVAASEPVVKEEVVVAASVSTNVPPVEAVYHLKVPDDADVAPRLTVPVPHLDALVIVGTAGGVRILATTVVRVLTQVPLSNST